MKHDMEELVNSLTGFDEIAVAKFFHSDYTQLQGTMLARALLFVATRRDGKSDGEAYKHAMDMRTDALGEQFVTGEPEGKAPGPDSTSSGPTSSSGPASPTPPTSTSP